MFKRQKTQKIRNIHDYKEILDTESLIVYNYNCYNRIHEEDAVEMMERHQRNSSLMEASIGKSLAGGIAI